MSGPSLGWALAAYFTHGADGLVLYLLRGDAREAIPRSIACLEPELDAGDAVEQLAVALLGATLVQPPQQR
jgi:hypothetical protein